MKNIILNIFTIIIVMINFNGLYSFPGDHEGYSCAGWKSSDCAYDPETGLASKPQSDINPTCGNDSVYGQNPIHNPDYHFTMFGDSLTDFVHDYGFFQFDAYFADAGFPVSVQNFGKWGETAYGITSNVGARPGYHVVNGEVVPIAEVLLNRCQPIGNNTKIWLDHQMIPDKTASRSLIMAGGNDVLFSGVAI